MNKTEKDALIGDEQVMMNALDSSISELSSCMTVASEVLVSNPPNNEEAWNQLTNWFQSIQISQEGLPPSVTIPNWKDPINIPSFNELDHLDSTDIGPEGVLGDYLLMIAALDVDFKYLEEGSSVVESMKLGELIIDVYPGLEPGIKEIRKDLKLAVSNPDKFKKVFISEDGKGMSLRRRFMLKGAAIATIALFLILSGSSCGEVPAYTDPETPTQPTSTATLVSTPTEKPTEKPTEELTEEPTETATSQPTETPSSTPTEEELYSPAAYSPMEEFKKYGYQIAACEFWGSEFNEWGLTVVGEFVFKGYKVTDEGLFLVGTRNFKNNDYSLEILVAPQISYYGGGSAHFLNDKEAIEKWIKVGRTYHFFAFVMNSDGTIIPYWSYDNYNEEEWKEIRFEIEEILRDGGSTSESYLLLSYIILERY